MNQFRLLHFDDLLILDGLLRGFSLTDVAQKMALTQPALSHRLRKIETVFNGKIVEKSGRKIILTPLGLIAARRATQALQIFSTTNNAKVEAVEIRLGSRLDIATDWIFPHLFRNDNKDLRCHLYQGTSEEIFHLLQKGFLDAIVTSSPVVAHSFRQIVLKEEFYYLCAAPSISRKINRVSELRHFTLIEHDITFPFRRYWPEAWRESGFKDVLFMGSTQVMAMALARGLGVGVIPDFVAKPYLRSNRLKRVFPQSKLKSDTFRLVYSESSHLRETMEHLSSILAQSK